MQTDYLVVGQGITGTLLSYFLLKEGGNIIVIDDNRPFSSSRVASGVINPVTGKRIVKTWMIDDLLPVALNTYRSLEQELDAAIIRQCAVLDIFARHEEREIFEKRASEEPGYLNIIRDEDLEKYFNFHYGVGAIAPAFLIDIHTLSARWRQFLSGRGLLQEEHFDIDKLQVREDGVVYEDITARKIIFCEGASGFDNPYFSLLSFSGNKGEVLIASIPGLPRDHIYKQGIKIVPWKENQFWIGSSFEWRFDHLQPTPIFRKRVEEHLKYWLKLPFEITDHWAAERPATVEYKPFAGVHPKFPAVGIFNGMGTKGCSLAPYFARQFARNLLFGEALLPDADIKRFSGVLNR